MATGGIFQLITNDGKQDRMLMASELLRTRLEAITAARRGNPAIPDPTPTLLDIEKTHELPAHMRYVSNSNAKNVASHLFATQTGHKAHALFQRSKVRTANKWRNFQIAETPLNFNYYLILVIKYRNQGNDLGYSNNVKDWVIRSQAAHYVSKKVQRLKVSSLLLKGRKI